VLLLLVDALPTSSAAVRKPYRPCAGGGGAPARWRERGGAI